MRSVLLPSGTRSALGSTIGRRIRNSHFDDENEPCSSFDTTKVLFNSRSGPQSFQPGASSRDPRGLQTETLGRGGRVARPHGLATDWLSACNAIRRPRVVTTMTKPSRDFPLIGCDDAWRSGDR